MLSALRFVYIEAKNIIVELTFVFGSGLNLLSLKLRYKLVEFLCLEQFVNICTIRSFSCNLFRTDVNNFQVLKQRLILW